ncbi:MAG: 2-C-methyl-D-erythritol 2,4-cyclodiphosphate synthase [Halanaerobiales bacterium]
MKIGLGYDIHKLVENESLILGGVEIDFHKGLKGHSDADVLVHALMDALLGAAGKGDIGDYFPDNDQQYKNISSLKLLSEVKKILQDENYDLINADMVIIAEKPKILPFKEKMILNLAEILEIEKYNLNIKATTAEGLGFVGSGEGIAAQAVVLIE